MDHLPLLLNYKNLFVQISTNVNSATQRAMRMQSVTIAMGATLVNVRMAILVMATQTAH